NTPTITPTPTQTPTQTPTSTATAVTLPTSQACNYLWKWDNVNHVDITTPLFNKLTKNATGTNSTWDSGASSVDAIVGSNCDATNGFWFEFRSNASFQSIGFSKAADRSCANFGCAPSSRWGLTPSIGTTAILDNGTSPGSTSTRNYMRIRAK